MASYGPDGLSDSSFQHISHSASSMPSPVAPTLAHILYYHTISAHHVYSPFSLLSTLRCLNTIYITIVSGQTVISIYDTL